MACGRGSIIKDFFFFLGLFLKCWSFFFFFSIIITINIIECPKNISLRIIFKQILGEKSN